MDGAGWRRLTRIANDELEKFRLNFSRCTNRFVALGDRGPESDKRVALHRSICVLF